MNISKYYKKILKIIIQRDSKVIHLYTRSSIKRGNVLLSYIVSPFTTSEEVLYHTNTWECREIVKILLEEGFNVDVINFTNLKFKPKKKYFACIDIHNNLERLQKYLNKNCIKILHITGAHWMFQNYAEYTRLHNLKERKGSVLSPRRIVSSSFGIETCDIATMLGNDFTKSTFSYANKNITIIPSSVIREYDFPKCKNFLICRKNFIWLGSSGLVHKGLDLVLDVFSELPDFHLYICGPIKYEKDFEKLYFEKLYQTKNITTIGLIDISSQDFIDLAGKCIGLVYPSCSEGCAGSVLTCMHAGLIPIISYESGVNIGDFGYYLKKSSIENIKNCVLQLSSLDIEELAVKTKKTWEFARSNYTREKFSDGYRAFIKELYMGKRG